MPSCTSQMDKYLQDIPSAPPFVSSGSAMEQVVGQSSAFSATTYVPKTTGSIPSTAPGKGCTGYKVSDVSNRLGACNNCFFSLIL